MSLDRTKELLDRAIFKKKLYFHKPLANFNNLHLFEYRSLFSKNKGVGYFYDHNYKPGLHYHISGAQGPIAQVLEDLLHRYNRDKPLLKQKERVVEDMYNNFDNYF